MLLLSKHGSLVYVLKLLAEVDKGNQLLILPLGRVMEKDQRQSCKIMLCYCASIEHHSNHAVV